MDSSEPVDYERLETYLRALAQVPRLELLHFLQTPRALAEIRLKPGRLRAGESPERSASRQAIQRHLEALQEIGVVATVGGAARGREFVVDPQGIYYVLEELRRAATLSRGSFVSRDETVDVGETSRRQMEPGPKLVLVHGFVEGRSFPLRRTDVKEREGWLIGRKPGLHVSLEYDPFVSLVNSEIRIDRGQYQLCDLGISRNGTWLNWRRVGPEPVPLKPGDVVGVGRSLLAFQQE